MHRGWMKLYRRIQDHWIWDDKPFSKGQAWIDLLLLANYDDKKKLIKGEVITCERGSVNLSIRELSTRWGWSRGKTKAFLELLEAEKMIELKMTTKRTVINIVNYSVFADSEDGGLTTKRPQNDHELTTEWPQTDTTKNIKNINNNNINKYIDLFKYGIDYDEDGYS